MSISTDFSTDFISLRLWQNRETNFTLAVCCIHNYVCVLDIFSFSIFTVLSMVFRIRYIYTYICTTCSFQIRATHDCMVKESTDSNFILLANVTSLFSEQTTVKSKGKCYTPVDIQKQKWRGRKSVRVSERASKRMRGKGECAT